MYISYTADFQEFDEKCDLNKYLNYLFLSEWVLDLLIRELFHIFFIFFHKDRNSNSEKYLRRILTICESWTDLFLSLFVIKNVITDIIWIPLGYESGGKHRRMSNALLCFPPKSTVANGNYLGYA